MNTKISQAIVTEPPVWFITACSTVFGHPGDAHLLLGNEAFDGAMAKLDELRKDFTAGEAVARAADFPKVKAAALT
jgi:hypothetical protein